MLKNWVSRMAQFWDRSPPPASHSSATPTPTAPAWLRVVEVEDGERYAGEIFRRCFHHLPPTYPRHYVALVEHEEREQTIGYIHYTALDDTYLCGGMCMDDRVYRRLPAWRRAELKAAGGVAELMLRHTFAELSHAKAIFGYVGDTRAERVDLRVGFRHTGLPHLIVYWPRPLPEEEQQALVARAAALGPF